MFLLFFVSCALSNHNIKQAVVQPVAEEMEAWWLPPSK